MEEHDIAAHSAARQHLREIYMNETCKNAIERTRRAESNMKAMEAILEATKFDQPTVLSPSPSMTLEDYRSQLVMCLGKLNAFQTRISELHAQQSVDSENINSLQESLERLHAVAASYRTDRDDLSNQLVSLVDRIRASNSDIVFDSINSLRNGFENGEWRISVVGDSHAAAAAAAEQARMEMHEQLIDLSRTIEERQSIIESRETDILNLESLVEDLKEKFAQMDATRTRELTEYKSRIETLESVKVQISIDLEEERKKIDEYEAKINEWTEWSVTVTGELEARNKEVELLEKYKATASEEIALLEERMRSESPPVGSVEVVAQLESEKTELENKINEWSIWAEQVTVQLSERDSEIESGRLKIIELEELMGIKQAEFITLTAELESVREQLNVKATEIVNLRLLEQELLRAKSTIANLRDQLNLNENLVSGSIEDMDRLREEFEKERDELKAKLIVRDATISVLTRKVDDAAAAAAAEPPAATEGQLDQLRVEIGELNSENDRLNRLIESIEGEKMHAIENLEIFLASEQEKSEKLERIIQVSENEKSELENRITDLMESLNEIALLKSQLDEVRESKNFFESHVTQLEEQVRITTGERDEMEHELETVRASQNELKMRHLELENRLEASMKEADEIGKLKSENLELQTRLDMAPVSEDQTNTIAELEARLIEWGRWADEITGQLAERDATIAELSMNQEHFAQSLAEAEALKSRVVELENSATERTRQLADDSPIGKQLAERTGVAKDHDDAQDISPRTIVARELEVAREKIQQLESEIGELKSTSPLSSKPRGVTSEEAQVLLDAYRAEIDRLVKENGQLRNGKKILPPNGGSSWWNNILDASPKSSQASPRSQSSPSSNRNNRL